MSTASWMAVALGGALGAPARYLVDGAVAGRRAGPFPWGTLVVNVAGSFLLGVVTGLVLHHGLGATARAGLGVGFCGGFTTFSTFSYETLRLVEEGAGELAARNVAANVVLALGAATLGFGLTSIV